MTHLTTCLMTMFVSRAPVSFAIHTVFLRQPQHAARWVNSSAHLSICHIYSLCAPNSSEKEYRKSKFSVNGMFNSA